jgi:hypothetical protein
MTLNAFSADQLAPLGIAATYVAVYRQLTAKMSRAILNAIQVSTRGPKSDRAAARRFLATLTGGTGKGTNQYLRATRIASKYANISKGLGAVGGAITLGMSVVDEWNADSADPTGERVAKTATVAATTTLFGAAGGAIGAGLGVGLGAMVPIPGADIGAAVVLGPVSVGSARR